MRLAYLIELFDKKTEKFVKYVEVPNLSDDDFRNIFNIPKDADVCGGYPIKLEQVERLKKFTPENFELEKYDYFIELTSLRDNEEYL